MADRYVFADEAGNFDFSVRPGASKYFILCTVTMDDCRVGDDLLRLRRDLGWKGWHLDRVPHATDDPPHIRNEIFSLLSASSFRADATIFEKRKAYPRIQTGLDLYKLAWFMHFKYVAPRIAAKPDRLFVVAAQIGTKRRRGHFHSAVGDVVQQVAPCRAYRVAFWPAASDPCLQVADYCTWAIQRDWERADPSYHNLIRAQVHSNKDMWSWGTTYYY